MNASQLFLDRLNQLKKDFAAQLPLRLQAIDDALQDCRAQPGDSARLQELYRLLHSLGGTAGSFGFAPLGLEARSIEAEVAALVQCGSGSDEEMARIAQAVQRLRQHLPAGQP